MTSERTNLVPLGGAKRDDLGTLQGILDESDGPKSIRPSVSDPQLDMSDSRTFGLDPWSGGPVMGPRQDGVNFFVMSMVVVWDKIETWQVLLILLRPALHWQLSDPANDVVGMIQ